MAIKFLIYFLWATEAFFVGRLFQCWGEKMSLKVGPKLSTIFQIYSNREPDDPGKISFCTQLVIIVCPNTLEVCPGVVDPLLRHCDLFFHLLLRMESHKSPLPHTLSFQFPYITLPLSTHSSDPTVMQSFCNNKFSIQFICQLIYRQNFNLFGLTN